MSRHEYSGHGTWQLEELLRAFEGLHDTLPTANADGMSAREVEGLYFVMRQLLLRFNDVFDLLMQEQVSQEA